jgi:hypothetical protein
MKRTGKLLAAGVAYILTGICPEVTSAAEGAVRLQNLMNVKAPVRVGARWFLGTECYSLQVWISKPTASTEQNEVHPPTKAQQHDERSGYFIGDAITVFDLRGLDPEFSCPTIRAAGLVPPNVVKSPRIEVWLLKADGTQMSPVDFTCGGCDAGSAAVQVGVSYRYLAKDGSQAIAAAIRIDDAFYIVKLLPLDRKGGIYP